MRTESDLEKLLAFHPYLINEEFAGLHPIRQLTCGKHRLDWDEAARRYVPYDSSRYTSDIISLIF